MKFKYNSNYLDLRKYMSLDKNSYKDQLFKEGYCHIKNFFDQEESEKLKTLSKKYLAEGGILLHSSWGDQRWHSALKFEPIPSNLVFPQEEILPFGNYFFVEAIFRELKPDENI